MTWRITLSPEAEDEIAGATDWYEDQTPGLGARFFLDVRETIDRIADNPRQYAITYRDTRRPTLRHFPYALLYRIGREEVRVLGCFHTSRDPRRWRARARR